MVNGKEIWSCVVYTVTAAKFSFIFHAVFKAIKAFDFEPVKKV